MGRTRIRDVRSDERTDGQPGDYLSPENFRGALKCIIHTFMNICILLQ
jgi:hypothetical protein